MTFEVQVYSWDGFTARLLENAVHVLAILHGAREWPESF